VLGWYQHIIFPAPVRLRGSAFWRTLVFVLEALVFILIGSSLRGVLDRVGGIEAVSTTMAVQVLAVVLTVAVARFIWIFGSDGLLAELRAQLAETRDSRARIVDAADTERRRLERNLHDGAQQRLVTLALHLRMAQETLRDDPPAAGAMLDGVGQDLKLALEELRELARGLHPAILTERGLAPALQSVATRAPFKVEIVGVPDERLPAAVEAAVYYVVAESLTNAAKHAGASEARVELSTTGDAVSVEIRDNGGGGASLAGGSGIRGLADRVEALGGRLELQSPVGAGTVVRAELPLR